MFKFNKIKKRIYGMETITGIEVLRGIRNQNVFMYSEKSIKENEEISFLDQINLANATELFSKIPHDNLVCSAIMTFKDEKEQLHSMRIFDYFDVKLGENDSLIVYDHTNKEEPDTLYSDIILYTNEPLQETLIEFDYDISNIEDVKRVLEKEKIIGTKNVA